VKSKISLLEAEANRNGNSENVLIMPFTIKAAALLILMSPQLALSETAPKKIIELAKASFHKAYENYSNSFEKCLNIEKSKPALLSTDINFLNKSQAGTLVILEKKSRLSACVLPAENNAIRKHIEAVNILRLEKASHLEIEELTQTTDSYYGLEDESDWERKNRYALIPEDLRNRFASVAEGKNLESNLIDLIENLSD